MRSVHWQRLAAGAVHVYTATGSVLALLIVLAAIDGDVERALWLGLVALVVDGTDGMLARATKVKLHFPWFDGARMDDIVDYLTYVFAPVVLLQTAGYLPVGVGGAVVAALPLLSSCYQFCRADAKTDDHFFLGFPSYWNVVAFYAVVLDLSVGAVATILLVCSALVFVPVRYLYPSRSTVLRTPNLVLAAAWLCLYAAILAGMPDPAPLLLWLSLAYVVYYVAMSVAVTLRHLDRRSADGRSAHDPVLEPLSGQALDVLDPALKPGLGGAALDPE
jgi:phosphatidylcholine synthase